MRITNVCFNQANLSIKFDSMTQKSIPLSDEEMTNHNAELRNRLVHQFSGCLLGGSGDRAKEELASKKELLGNTPKVKISSIPIPITQRPSSTRFLQEQEKPPGFAEAEVNENILLQEITDIQKKLKQIQLLSESKATKLFHEFEKHTTNKIAANYLELAKLYSSNDLEKSNRYWNKALEALQNLCNTQNVDGQIWFDLSTLYFFPLQLYTRNILKIPREEAINFIHKGLEAVNHAFQIDGKQEAIYRKFLFLQLSKELGTKPSENPTDYLSTYLDKHSDPSSIDYLENAHIYGSELAKEGCLKEAQEWFEQLDKKKKDPITCLYLGKMMNHSKQEKKAQLYFEEALKLDPNNLEIQLWHISQKIKNTAQEIRACKERPSEEKIKEIVDVCNQFWATFNRSNEDPMKETSTFIPLSELAQHFFLTTLPEMADLLNQLGQFHFSLSLHKTMLIQFEEFEKYGVLDKSEKIKIYVRIGLLYSHLGNLQKADKCYQQALELDNTYLVIYQNLIGVYARQRDVIKLDALRHLVESLLSQASSPDNLEVWSAIFFNFGTAYANLVGDNFKKAQECYHQSLQCNKENKDSKLHLARILAVFRQDLGEAKDLLTECVNDNGDNTPFAEFPLRDYQIYFCLSGIYALLGDTKQADKWAIEAGKTRFNADETGNLQSYLQALKKPNSDSQKIKDQIQASIQRISFNYRIGKILDSKSINIQQNELVGYHGTIDLYAEDLKNGIKPREIKTRQFSGTGFYIARDREIAEYFAMKKAKDEGKGSPVLVKVYSSTEMIGKEVDVHFKITKETGKAFDFLRSLINGFEGFHQYYVLENSLKKLASKEIEPVSWTEEEYNKFLSVWTRSASTDK